VSGPRYRATCGAHANFRVRLVDAANNTSRVFFLDDVRVVVTWTR
jgi:hypothetical protein